MKNNKLEIKINNFGPIIESKFKISPLTIFIGENNAGKSYAAMLTHILTKELNAPEFIPSDLAWTYWSSESINKLQNNKESNKKLENFINDMVNYIKKEPFAISEKFFFDYSEFEYFLDNGILLLYSDIINDRLNSQFNTNIKNLVNIDKDFFEISFEGDVLKSDGNNIKVMETEDITSKKNKNHNDYFIRIKFYPEESFININYEIYKEKILNSTNNEITDTFLKEEMYNIFRALYSEIATETLKNAFKYNSYYIPYNRGDSSIKQAKIFSEFLKNKRNHRSEIQNDLLYRLGNIDEENKSPFYDLALDFEKELIDGKIDFVHDNDSGEYYYLQEKNNLKIPLYRSSSSIIELAPIITYLKYLVQKNDIVIIEEPEAHINPKKQRIFVKYMAKFINKGVKFVITTHSDYIIEQVNNFILLKDLETKSSSLNDKLNYSHDDLLSKEDVNVYIFEFENSKNGYLSKKLNIGEFGIEEESFNEIINELYFESNKIRKHLAR